MNLVSTAICYLWYIMSMFRDVLGWYSLMSIRHATKIIPFCIKKKKKRVFTQHPHWRPTWNHPILSLSIPVSACWQPSWACARSRHLWLGNGSDTFCNDPLPTTQYCLLLAPYKPYFLRDHPSSYYFRISMLNCGVLIGSWSSRL
jgi:hypothetical protein